MGFYDQRLNLMLSTGEAFEMLHVMQDVKNLSAIVGMDALLPVDDYLDDYPELVEKFSDLEWDGALVNGVHYAIPCYWQSFDQTMSYMTVRTDVMKAVGYDEFPSDSVEDVIDLMRRARTTSWRRPASRLTTGCTRCRILPTGCTGPMIPIPSTWRTAWAS